MKKGKLVWIVASLLVVLSLAGCANMATQQSGSDQQEEKQSGGGGE